MQAFSCDCLDSEISQPKRNYHHYEYTDAFIKVEQNSVNVASTKKKHKRTYMIGKI